MSIADGPVAPKPPSQVSAGISISGRNSTFVTVFTLRPSRVRDLVTMVEAGPTYTRTGQNGRRISFPGRWDGTQLAGQIGATYVTVWIRVHISTCNFVKRLLTYLGKLDRLTKLCDFPQLRQAQKQRDFYVENVGIKRRNLSLTVEKCSL